MHHSLPRPKTATPRPEWRGAVLVTTLLIAAIGLWHGRGLGDGGLSHYDEFYTFDRTMGFSALGDWWAVFALGEPSPKKPPLQYWMSAGLMELGADDLIALRLPSLLFGICTMIATAALAAVMVPKWPWVAPVSVAVLSTSTRFWEHTTPAMLDGGASFFSTPGILAILLALKDRRYWLVFPVAVFLAGCRRARPRWAFCCSRCWVWR